jgi:hypothetical protein
VFAIRGAVMCLQLGGKFFVCNYRGSYAFAIRGAVLRLQLGCSSVFAIRGAVLCGQLGVQFCVVNQFCRFPQQLQCLHKIGYSSHQTKCMANYVLQLSLVLILNMICAAGVCR